MDEINEATQVNITSHIVIRDKETNQVLLQKSLNSVPTSNRSASNRTEAVDE